MNSTDWRAQRDALAIVTSEVIEYRRLMGVLDRQWAERFVTRAGRGDVLDYQLVGAAEIDEVALYERFYGDVPADLDVRRPLPLHVHCRVCGTRYAKGTYRDHCRTKEHEECLSKAAIRTRDAYAGKSLEAKLKADWEAIR